MNDQSMGCVSGWIVIILYISLNIPRPWTTGKCSVARYSSLDCEISCGGRTDPSPGEVTHPSLSLSPPGHTFRLPRKTNALDYLEWITVYGRADYSPDRARVGKFVGSGHPDPLWTWVQMKGWISRGMEVAAVIRTRAGRCGYSAQSIDSERGALSKFSTSCVGTAHVYDGEEWCYLAAELDAGVMVGMRIGEARPVWSVWNRWSGRAGYKGGASHAGGMDGINVKIRQGVAAGGTCLHYLEPSGNWAGGRKKRRKKQARVQLPREDDGHRDVAQAPTPPPFLDRIVL
ncbi:hypothetical protein AG1IA_04797 [Rhizoctonia solani AG-1 IA]|uniref:Uncharacterized protein n=1 Tax=Thanatephorus cucumeris (strain AG1-IA) TaxID=983506 RepID=L8WWG6_THACA|nr:hypothetical protein AG1IA_04797 [Rhizoctonia solani AG-1 IA]